MKITTIRIKNFLGVEEEEIRPGDTTIIEGPNGSGKTSRLEALRWLIGGGHEASLIRQGAEEAEVVLLLDNGETWQRSVDVGGKPKLEIINEYGGKITSGTKSYISALSNALGLNPVALLNASAKERTEIILKALPMEGPTADKLAREIGANETLATRIQIRTKGAKNPLEAINSVYTMIYDDRTGINAVVRESEAAANAMGEAVSGALPPAEELRKQLAGRRDLRSKAMVERSEAVGKANREAAELITRMERAEDEEIRKIKAKYANELQAVQVKTRESVTNLQTGFNEAIANHEKVIAVLEEQERHVTAAEQDRARYQEWQARAAKGRTESDRLTEMLNRIQGIKRDLIAKLPIEGVDVEDGEILLHGIPFDRCSTSEKVDFVVQLAALASGKLALVVVDDLEHLDSTVFAELMRKMKDRGVQLIGARVSNEALRVLTL